jgi:mediator of RNA polymerase II transcription subunit 12
VTTPLTSQGVQEILDVASEQLRLLAHVVELARDDQTALPVVDPVAQDSFIEALASKIQAFETILAHTQSDVPPDQATQGAILMARLLQFNMAFRGVWTARARSLSEELCRSVFNLALVSSKYPAGNNYLTIVRPMVRVTISILPLSHSFSILTCTSSMVGCLSEPSNRLCHLKISAELAIDTKANSADIFRNYPQIHLADLPPDMPAEYRQQLRCLLPYPPSHEGQWLTWYMALWTPRDRPSLDLQS